MSISPLFSTGCAVAFTKMFKFFIELAVCECHYLKQILNEKQKGKIPVFISTLYELGNL